jgi:hypothetical protein
MDEKYENMYYDKCDKAYEKYRMEDDYDDNYDDDDDDDEYGATHKFTNYEELLSLTEQEETEDKLKNIVFALMKAVVQLKCKEVSFKFDFKFGSYNSWVEISTYFNSNHVGTDYRILINEYAIVCILLNENLIA